MKALTINGYEGEQHAVIVDLPALTPGPDEVLVKVRAAAVNPLDMKLARGYLKDVFPLKFPHVLGTDLAGTIERVGTRVQGLRPGDEVLARLETHKGGAFAERAVVPARLAVRAPTSFRVEEASALGTVAATAWQALFEVAKISASTRLLVIGGAGAVGSMAVRFAASVGANVFATTHAADADMALRLGAQRVFDSQSKIELRDLDVVFDTVGGDAQPSLFGLLREGGLLAAIPSPPDTEAARARNIDARFVFHDVDGSRLALVTSYCAARDFRP